MRQKPSIPPRRRISAKKQRPSTIPPFQFSPQLTQLIIRQLGLLFGQETRGSTPISLAQLGQFGSFGAESRKFSVPGRHGATLGT